MLNNTNQYISKVTFNTPLRDSTDTSPINLSCNNGVEDSQNNNNNSCNLNSTLNDNQQTNVENEASCTKLQKIIANYTEKLLCCLRSIYRQGCVPPPPSWNSKLLSTLIKYGYSPPINQECVANILAYACKVGFSSLIILLAALKLIMLHHSENLLHYQIR